MGRLTVCIAAVTMIVSFSTSGLCASPYSANGIGVIVDDDFGLPGSMGGAGVAFAGDGNMIRSNPALLATFDHHVYSLAAIHRRNYFDGPGNVPTIAETTPELFRLVLPVSRGVVFGWGLTPYSRTDINIGIPGDTYTDQLKSTGGINVSTTGLGWSFRNVFHIGVSLNYMFGTINEEWDRTFPESSAYENTTNYLKMKYRGYAGSVGLLVRVPFRTTLGLSYTQEAELDRTVRVRPADLTNPEVEYLADTRYLPRNWRLGLSKDIGTRVTAVADLALADWAEAAVTPTEKLMFNDTWQAGAGLHFVPTPSVTASYLRQLPLSIGFKVGTLYYKSYPVVNEVTEWAVTGGIEFPFLDGMGSIITSFEAGSRGDRGTNGWKETFFNTSITLVGVIE